jgi:hypothetical protein
MNRIKLVAHVFAAIVIGVLVSLTASAQNASFAGKYEGTNKDETGEQKLTLDLVETSGKFTGSLTTGRGSFKILKGQMADGTLTLEIEKPAGSSGSMAFRKSGDDLIATFTEAGKNLTINFRKVTPDEISGDWDAVADAQGQPFPFTLALKLDGDKITGSSNSQLGQGNITTGTWKDGKLAVVLDGNITLVATMIEGKLSGDYDFAGQSSGKWVAVKKK